ncbi:MAG: hypothetical protein FJ387_29905 [Verrucomicrobia bacterium]|nr:hypothetical protein [Verrucomicrobiota bacterium]
MPPNNLHLAVVAGALALAPLASVGASAPERFLGGPYDGYASARLDRLVNLGPERRVLGGPYDGYASARLERLVGLGPERRFFGGTHDGYASARFMPAVAPNTEARCLGGGYDGHARAWLLQVDALVRTLRFGGGAYDGSDRSDAHGLPNPLDRDSDGDGLPDWWELPFFGSVTGGLLSADDDQDGLSTWQEYVADTDPTNPASRLHISAWSRLPTWTAFFPASASRVYTLEYTTDLNSASWTNLPSQTLVPVSLPIGSLVDTNRAPTRFYRIRVDVPP